MRVDYKKLSQIAVDSDYRNLMAKDTSEVLTNYLYMMSNLNADVDKWSAAEMAMITNSLNRWQDKMTLVSAQNITVGDIIMVDFGLNYAPELSYGHPALVLEEWKNLVLVVPTTSSTTKIAKAYHPTDNPNGKWYYRKVTNLDGFSHDGVLILNNLRIVAKSAILCTIGNAGCDWKNEDNLVYEIKRTIIKNMFAREYSKHLTDLKKLESAMVEIERLAKDMSAKEKYIECLEQELRNLRSSIVDNTGKI